VEEGARPGAARVGWRSWVVTIAAAVLLSAAVCWLLARCFCPGGAPACGAHEREGAR
jgi:hypothetical protein